MLARVVFQALPISVALLVAGGRLRLTIDRWSIALVVGAFASLLASRIVGHGTAVLVVAAFSIGTVGLVRVIASTSRSRVLASLAGIGCLANLVPIIAFGAMPVSAAARRAMSAAPAAEPAVFAAKHVEVVDGGALSGLGDVISVPAARAIVSVGDIIVLAAFVGLGATQVVRRRRTI